MIAQKIVTPLFFIFVTLLGALAQGSQGDFWVLRTDTVTAKAIANQISGKKQSPEDFNKSMSRLVSSSRVTELARFQQKWGNGVTKMNKSPGEIKMTTVNAKFPMGVFIQADPIFAVDVKVCELKYSAQISEKEKGLQYHTKTVNTMLTMVHNDWHLLSQWKNETAATLLLARILELPDRDQKRAYNTRSLDSEIELIETTKANFEKYKIAPEPKEKAIIWLRSQSKMIRTANFISKHAAHAKYTDQYICPFSKWDGAWEKQELGLTLNYSVGVDDPESDIQGIRAIGSNWQGVNIFKKHQADAKAADDEFEGIAFKEGQRARRPDKFKEPQIFTELPGRDVFNAEKEFRKDSSTVVEAIVDQGTTKVLVLIVTSKSDVFKGNLPSFSPRNKAK